MDSWAPSKKGPALNSQTFDGRNAYF